MKLKIVTQYMFYALCATLGAACDDDNEIGEVNALPEFSFAVDAGDKQLLTFNNESNGGEFYQWNFGDGAKSAQQSPTHRYVVGGTYKVTLIAKTKNGSKLITRDVIVESNVVNLIAGSDMSTPGAWNVFSAGMTLTTVTFTDGKLKLSNGSGSAQTNVLVWQAIQVDAGKNYNFTAQVSGSGASNTWVELFFSQTKPTDGSDFSAGKYIEINTWAGCGATTFSGDITTIGCGGPGAGKNGAITFAQSGTWYFVIKAGSWDGSLGTAGISFDDVTLVEAK